MTDRSQILDDRNSREIEKPKWSVRSDRMPIPSSSCLGCSILPYLATRLLPVVRYTGLGRALAPTLCKNGHCSHLRARECVAPNDRPSNRSSNCKPQFYFKKMLARIVQRGIFFFWRKVSPLYSNGTKHTRFRGSKYYSSKKRIRSASAKRTKIN